MHCTYKGMLRSALTSYAPRASTLPPAFLLPAFSSSQTAYFSASSTHNARQDGNPSRGISALRRSGLNKKTRNTYNRITSKPLPKPVLNPERRSQIEVDEEHGLWEFFGASRNALATPEELNAHGRAWTVPELRNKGWTDLHKLWWVCLKERNRLATAKVELLRLKVKEKPMYGDFEALERLKEINGTMRGIKHVLTERYYAWQNARALAVDDEEVDFYANTQNGETFYKPAPEATEVSQLAEHVHQAQADIASQTVPGSQSEGSASEQQQPSLPPPNPPRPSHEARI